MSLRLKPFEICKDSDKCKHKRDMNSGLCYGCDPKRDIEFTCYYVDSQEIPYTPDITIKGRQILHG